MLDALDGEARHRLDEALRDSRRSEPLVAALQRWEILEGNPVASYRARHGIAEGRAARTRLRGIQKMLDRLPDDYMARMIPDLIAAALEIEGRPGAPQGHIVGRAARKAARAIADLRALVVQAEAAAPRARGAQPQAATSARRALGADLRRALGCPDDDVFKETRQVLWWVLTGATDLPDDR